MVNNNKLNQFQELYSGFSSLPKLDKPNCFTKDLAKDYLCPQLSDGNPNLQGNKTNCFYPLGNIGNNNDVCKLNKQNGGQSKNKLKNKSKNNNKSNCSTLNINNESDSGYGNVKAMPPNKFQIASK